MEAKRQARRTSINGVRNILTVKGKDPDKEYRWVADVDDRIETLREWGWVVETDKALKVGDKRVNSPTSEGTPVTKSGGAGVTLFLMSIKKEYFKEDQDGKQKEIDRIEASIKADAKANSDYGKLETFRD